LSYTPRWEIRDSDFTRALRAGQGRATLTDSNANSGLSLLVTRITPPCVLSAPSGALPSVRGVRVIKRPVTLTVNGVAGLEPALSGATGCGSTL